MQEDPSSAPRCKQLSFLARFEVVLMGTNTARVLCYLNLRLPLLLGFLFLHPFCQSFSASSPLYNLEQVSKQHHSLAARTFVDVTHYITPQDHSFLSNPTNSSSK